MKAISKEMKKRQKHFPWLKTFIKEFFKTYPSCKQALKCLIENIEKEVKSLRNCHKRKTKALFETVNDLYLHFWWKIHWKKNSQWKNYCNLITPHSYQFNETTKCFGKLLNFLIYLGIILSQEASDSLWINRVLQAINILPATDEIVYDALLQLHYLKKKYQSSYMDILRHILCSEIIINISQPAVYIKSLMLFRRLKNFTEDEVAKASIISTASKIKPPSDLASWLSSLAILINDKKSIVDQLFKKNSKVFQKLYHVLIDSENGGNSESKNKESKSKFKKKSENNISKDENLFRKSVDLMDTTDKDTNFKSQPFENKKNGNEKNNNCKKILDLSELCKKIKNSREKKKLKGNGDANLINAEISTESKQQPKNAKASNLNERTENSFVKHKKSKKKKKSKARNDVAAPKKKHNAKFDKTSKNSESERLSKKLMKKKKSEKINSVNETLDNKKHNLETNSFNDVSVNSNSLMKGTNNKFEDGNDSNLFENNLMINKEKSNCSENYAMKEEKITQTATENQISQTDKERYSATVENSKDKISNVSDLRSKLPNLLANYEVYSSAEESETAKKCVSSCPLVESNDNILVPDTCQIDVNTFEPFNLDSWIPSKEDTSRDTSITNDGSLTSDKYPHVPLTDIKKNIRYRNNQSDNSNLSFNDSVVENINDSEVSQDTFISNYGSEISDRYPYVSLIDIRKNKKLNLYKKCDYSSFDDSVTGNTNDSEISQDTCISYASQISDKNPYVSLTDIKKMKNLSDYSNSSFDSYFVGNVTGSEISEETFISNEGSQMSDKDSNDLKEADKTTDDHCETKSNYDPILGFVDNSFSNQNTEHSSSHDLHTTKNQNNESLNSNGGNHHEANGNTDPETPFCKTRQQSKVFQEKNSPCNKHSTTETTSSEQSMGDINVKTKKNSPTKRKGKQTSYAEFEKVKMNFSNQNPEHSSSNNLLITKNQNNESLNSNGGNHHKTNGNMDPKSPIPMTHQQNKKNSPCNTQSTEAASMEDGMVDNDLKTKRNTPTKRKGKQTSYTDCEQVKINFSNQNPEHSSSNNLLITKSRNYESLNSNGGNHHKANGNTDPESPFHMTRQQSKKNSPCNKHSTTETTSMEQRMVDKKLKTKRNTPTKRNGKQTSYTEIKQLENQKCNSNYYNEDLVQPRDENCCHDLGASVKDLNEDPFMNDLSTLLGNHGDVETQEDKIISPSKDIALNQSDTQHLSPYQEHVKLHEESNILPHEWNGNSSATHTIHTKQPCMVLTNENHQNNVPTCSLETVLDKLIETELSNVRGSCKNLNSVPITNGLNDNVKEKAHVESVPSVEENTFDPLHSISSSLTSHCVGYESNVNSPQQNNNQSNMPSHCFGYNSHENSPQQNNNQSNMLSVSLSSNTENRSVESEVAGSLLNLSANENPERITLVPIPDCRRENASFVSSNFNSGNSNFVVDCNIINDFDTRNSSQAGSSVSEVTPSIKVIVNLINSKPENSSNPSFRNPNLPGNSFMPTYNSSRDLHSSVSSNQAINSSNFSFPTHRSNNYFSEPPFFLRRNVNELDTLPDGESHLRMPRLPLEKNIVSSFPKDATDFICSESKERFSTPRTSPRKRQRKEVSHSSESVNEWEVNHLDLNSSFSNIPSLQTVHQEEVLRTLNSHRRGNSNRLSKGNQHKEPVSRTFEPSTSCGEKSVLKPSRLNPYRSSQSNIYSDESEDELSVSTMSLLSGISSDHTLLSDSEISPKTPVHRKNITASKNKTKKLFREEKFALDSVTPGASAGDKSTVMKQLTSQKKKRQTKVATSAKKPKTATNHDYYLRTRKLLTPPTKLNSYYI